MLIHNLKYKLNFSLALIQNSRNNLKLK